MRRLEEVARQYPELKPQTMRAVVSISCFNDNDDDNNNRINSYI